MNRILILLILATGLIASLVIMVTPIQKAMTVHTTLIAALDDRVGTATDGIIDRITSGRATSLDDIRNPAAAPVNSIADLVTHPTNIARGSVPLTAVTAAVPGTPTGLDSISVQENSLIFVSIVAVFPTRDEGDTLNIQLRNDVTNAVITETGAFDLILDTITSITLVGISNTNVDIFVDHTSDSIAPDSTYKITSITVSVVSLE